MLFRPLTKNPHPAASIHTLFPKNIEINTKFQFPQQFKEEKDNTTRHYSNQTNTFFN
jgi:hypothetical protein